MRPTEARRQLGESIKAVLALVCILLLGLLFAGWVDDRPNAVTWALRTLPVLGLLAIFWAYWKIDHRSDLAPDFLRQAAGDYVNRDGFCFAVAAESAAGVCYLRMLFQNQFAQPCRAKLAVRIVRFAGRRLPAATTSEIACPGGGYGVVTMPLAVPKKFQGKSATLDVGADVEYPGGKGQRLRFYEGVRLDQSTKFISGRYRLLASLALFGGMVYFRSPTRAHCQLPTGVAETLPADLGDAVRIISQVDAASPAEAMVSNQAFAN